MTNHPSCTHVGEVAEDESGEIDSYPINELGEPPQQLHETRRVAPGGEWLPSSFEACGIEGNDQDKTTNGAELYNFCDELGKIDQINELPLFDFQSAAHKGSSTLSVSFCGDESPRSKDLPSPCSDQEENEVRIDMDNGDSLGSASSEYLKIRFAEAKNQARKRRLRITVPCLIIGLSFFGIGEIVAVYISQVYTRSHILSFFGQVLIGPGVLIYFLGLLPTDHRAVRITIRISIFFHSLAALAGLNSIRSVSEERKNNLCLSAGHEVPCSTSLFRLVYQAFYVLVTAFVVFRSSRSLFLAPRPMSQMMWFISGVAMLNQSMLWCSFIITDVMSSLYSLLPADIILLGVYLATGTLFMWPNFRFHTQAWLASKGESAASAAGVAVLLGATDIKEVILASRKTFCAVSAEKLTEADMAEQTPNPALSKHTHRVKLGQVDAFVSHSWHDDPQSKWRELQDWRKFFKTKHGREPRLWIDKYCVDQSNIDDSLSCLPVYLMGCQRLLILCGATYLQRLWCLVEIFTFKEMGGLRSSLECRLLDRSEEMLRDIENFDVYKAKCFAEYDTSRLLSVMEAGADSLDELRDWIQSSLLAKIDERYSNRSNTSSLD